MNEAATRFPGDEGRDPNRGRAPGRRRSTLTDFEVTTVHNYAREPRVPGPMTRDRFFELLPATRHVNPALLDVVDELRKPSAALRVPDKAPEAQAAVAKPAIPAAPAPEIPLRRPLISDEEEFMIEVFVTGYGACPPGYREDYYEAWIRSHSKDARLLFTAWLAIDVLEQFDVARREASAKESA